ncbi:nucleotide sugar dehydrogenase [Thermodesulfobacteriota bacterium]
MKPIQDSIIAVIGLGYVGLPLAVTFGKRLQTIGFDLDKKKVHNLSSYQDVTREVSEEDLRSADRLTVTSDPAALGKADFIIIAVPTPIDHAHQPDLKPLKGATRTVGDQMKKGAIVIYESTVYPGVTEEVCVPILEKASQMTWRRDFFVGYSPERINPGDKEHTLEKIVKVVAGDCDQTLNRITALYELVVAAGIFRTSSIKEAEAAKVIENTQRDLNIALINELAIIFDRLGIDTKNVLQAAGTKWNFLPFRPGLVGGHCIGVDPYYLTHKAETVGYHPQVILAGRRINDGMGKFVAEKTVKLMIQSGRNVHKARVGVLGVTFKENCPDIRNTQVVDIVTELKSYGIEVLIHDPLADLIEANRLYGIDLCKWEDLHDLEALILAVAHTEYMNRPISEIIQKIFTNGCLIDIKSVFNPDDIKQAGIRFWRL